MTNTITDTNLTDPLGKAIQDYFRTGINVDIEVLSDFADPDILPSQYLFRTEQEMPYIEQLALKNCKGSVLDCGAGAGAHAEVLQKAGLHVNAIDISPLAVEVMRKKGIQAFQSDFFDYQEGKFDTLLFLMNGIGIVERLDNLDNFFAKAAELLNENGVIICDSTDIKYLYEEEDGSMWVDLNGSYYGELQFQMKYGDIESAWFKWLYIDEDLLQQAALRNGFSCDAIYREDGQFLALLKKTT